MPVLTSGLNRNLRQRVSVAFAAAGLAFLVAWPSAGRAQSNPTQAPLIEADKTPTRVRPATPAKPKPVPAMQLPVQGIPTMPQLGSPDERDASGAPGTAIRAKPGARPRAGKPSALHDKLFKVQLASAKTAAAAAMQVPRLRQRFGAQVAGIDLRVERAPHGLYRVVTQPIPGQRAARDVCAAVAARHGSCVVVATRTAPAVPVMQVAKPREPAAPIRAQLASLRSYEGATREVERLTRRYGDVLDRNVLTISRIDQAGRGTFYRVLTAPLPDRGAASGLCQRMALHAGCVLIRDRHREVRLSVPTVAGPRSA